MTLKPTCQHSVETREPPQQRTGDWLDWSGTHEAQRGRVVERPIVIATRLSRHAPAPMWSLQRLPAHPEERECESQLCCWRVMTMCASTTKPDYGCVERLISTTATACSGSMPHLLFKTRAELVMNKSVSARIPGGVCRTTHSHHRSVQHYLTERVHHKLFTSCVSTLTEAGHIHG